VRATLPLGRRLIDEPQVGFVDQGGGVEGLVALPTPPLPLGGPVELVVDEREELGEGVLIPCPQLLEE
jgi:hypothetical protein